MKKSFKQKVLEVVAKIRKGEVLSYGEVARLAGSPLAARAVGTILRNNFKPKIPCHRVLPKSAFSKNGQIIKNKIGNYNRGKKKKLELLIKEGVFK